MSDYGSRKVYGSPSKMKKQSRKVKTLVCANCNGRIRYIKVSSETVSCPECGLEIPVK